MQAYDDYIAARFLLNNDYPAQGVTLAATAIEKYFKAMLAGMNIPFKWIHLDELEKIKRKFDGSQYAELFTKYLDSTFLTVLGDAYKFRYLDGITDISQYGFLVHHILGELDNTVTIFEHLIILKEKDVRISHYHRAVAEKCPDLFENNFFLNGIPKDKFMEQPGKAFAIHYNPSRSSPVVLLGENIQMPRPYQGHIFLVYINEGSHLDG